MTTPALRVAFLLPVLLVPALGPAAVAGMPRAERIDVGNIAELRQRGPDAIGGLEDWHLGDGILCATISDPSHESDFSPTGGSLIDLGRCGRGDDQFLLFDQMLNLSLRQSVPASHIRAEADATGARVVVSGESDGLQLETVYALDTAAPGRLQVRSRLTRARAGNRLFALGAAFANAHGLRPFVTSVGEKGRSRGFVGPAFLGKGPLEAAAAAVAADTVVLVGESLLEPGVSYGVRLHRAERQRASGPREPLPTFLLADDLATVVAIFSRPFWVGGDHALGWLQLLQSRFMDLEVGGSLHFHLELVVGERADVASALDQLDAGEAEVRGRVEDPTTHLHFDTPGGVPVTEVRPRADGQFALRLKPGRYRLRIEGEGGRRRVEEIEIGPAGRDLGRVALPPAARISLPSGTPLRLVFRGVDGTPDPVFGDDHLGFEVLGAEEEIHRTAAVPWISLMGTPADAAEVAIPAGRYRVYATRGPEFTVTEADLVAVQGKVTALEIEPPVRAIDTPGWISADLHVHSERSMDTGLPAALRLASFVAEQAEVLVATDHDAITDYGPLARELGLVRHLATVVGVEITSEAKTQAVPHTIGHANAFPVQRDELAYRGGVPANEGRRWREVLPELRARGARIVQLNHARVPEGGYHPGGFFTHLGIVGEPFEPGKSLQEWPNRVLLERAPGSGARDLDFDAMELLNGKRTEAYPALREDWFSLWRQGIRITGTANSDSHILGQIAAAPRTYVAVGDDRVEAFRLEEFAEALGKGRAFGTTGPMLDVRLGEAGPGETHGGAKGSLSVRIFAAPWVPVSRLRVLVDGRPVRELAIDGPGTWDIPLAFARDAFVTVDVEGTPGPVYRQVLPGFTPLAFSNPILVDADQNGEWSAPGAAAPLR